MTRDDITHMAREAGFVGFDVDNPTLRRFACLVADAERKACAQVCESDVGMLGKGDLGEFWADKCAAAIRSRGNK